ncbi:AsmA family protein [Candidatus Sumerlaeota bacterium]|nr:AsmA family protein [Candidatus Sumerlaeota bacterium]
MEKENDIKKNSPEKPKKKRRWIKILAIAFGALIVLLIIGFVYISSAHFYRHIVFPMAGKKIHREIRAERIRIRPLSRVELGNFTITNPGNPKEPPLVKLGGLVMNYKGSSFLKGAPQIASISVLSPEANLVLYADGKTNLDGMMTAEAKPQPAKPQPGQKPPEPMKLPDFAMKLLEVSKGNVRVTQLDNKGNLIRNVSLENIGFKMTDMQPDKNAHMSFSMNLNMEDVPAKSKIDRAEIQSSSSLFFSKDLSKLNMGGNLSLNNFDGTFQGSRMDGYSMIADVKLAKDKDAFDLEPFSIRFEHKNQTAASMEAAGSYDQKKGEGQFNLDVKNIDKKLLNLIGAYAGNIDFRNTAMTYKGDVKIADQNAKVEISGALDVKRFSVLAPQYLPKPTEEMDFSFHHKMVMDNKSQVLSIPTMQIKAVQKGKDVVNGNLEQPLTLDLSGAGKSAPSAPPIQYSLQVNKFDLAPFFALAPLPEGTLIGSADVNSNITINFKDNGKSISVNGDASLDNFSGKVMNNNVPSTDFSLKTDVTVADFNKVDIKTMDFSILRKNGPQSQGKIKGSLDIAAGSGTINLESLLFDLMTVQPFMPPDPVLLKSGKINAKAAIKLSKQFSVFDVNSAADITGFGCEMKSGDVITRLNMDFSYSLNMNYDLAGKLEIGDFKTAVKSEGKEAGDVSLKGNIDLNQGKGALNLSAKGINQNAFNPFLTPYIKDMEMTSLKMDMEQQIQMSHGFQNIQVNGETSAADLKIKQGQSDLLPPLVLGLKNNLGYQPSKLTIGELALKAHPPDKPVETILLTGDLVMGEKGDMKSTMKIQSDQITIDHFLPPEPAGEAKAPAPKTTAPAPQPVLKELEPLDLNFFTLDGDVNIKKMLFRDVVFSDLYADINMAQSTLDYPTVTMKINNAPVNAKGYVKMNVPGWEYYVNSNLENLDVKPLVDSFSPEYKDQITGTAFFKMDVKGRGTLPENLQKHLKGTINGNLKDGKFSGVPILTKLAEAIKIKELEVLRFFDGVVNLDIADGKINIQDMYFKGQVQKLGLKGWFGLDEKIDLLLQLGLAAPLSGALKELKYVSDVAQETEDGYTELPVPVGMTGTFTKPIASFKITKILEEKGKEFIKDAIRDQLKKRLFD